MDNNDSPGHEHPPWTATSRGVAMSLRRLAMLEPVYRLAPDLLLSGRAHPPAGDTAVTRDARMTDFRLLRHGGFYHAVARYGEDLWTPFTFAGIHATERVLRRKEQHRFWGVDSYSHEEGRYLRIGNRTFYEDPEQEVGAFGPGGGGRGRLGQGAGKEYPERFYSHHLLHSRWPVHSGGATAPLPGPGVRPHRPSVSGQAGERGTLAPARTRTWRPSTVRLAHRLFLAVCQFPAMRASWLGEVVGGNSGEVSRHLRRFVETGLVAVFDGRHYLSELGMRRAANMSRVLPAIIRSRHGAYLDRWYREHELLHNDGVNRLVVRFAREGVDVVAGWRGEVNVPGLTQVRPDLLVRVRAGTLGPGMHCIEFERYSIQSSQVEHKLGPYRRMAALGRPLPTAGGLRDGAGPEHIPGRHPEPAHADRHPGAGLGRTGNRPGDGVGPGRAAGRLSIAATDHREYRGRQGA